MKEIPYDLEPLSEPLEHMIFDDGGGGDILDLSFCFGFQLENQQEEFQLSAPHYYCDKPSGSSQIADSPESNWLVQVSSSNGLNTSGLDSTFSQEPKDFNPKKLEEKSKKIQKQGKPKDIKPTNKKPRKRKPRATRPLPQRINQRIDAGHLPHSEAFQYQNPAANKKHRKRKPRTTRPLPQRINQRIDAGHTPHSEAFKYQNPGKNTPKRVSIFLRKKLEQSGFDIKKIQSKRVRPGYLHICFLHLRHRSSEHGFHLLMEEYRQWLRSEIDWQQSLYNEYGDEVSQHYVQDLEMAGRASIEFEQKRQLDSLKTFLGDGKEQKYRGQNMIMYIEELRWIFRQKNHPFPIPEEAELHKINEKSLWSLQKIVRQIEGLQAKENFVDSVLDLE